MAIIDILKIEIAPEHKKDLIARLNQEGFKIFPQGHIHVAQPKPSHPTYAALPL